MFDSFKGYAFSEFTNTVNFLYGTKLSRFYKVDITASPLYINCLFLFIYSSKTYEKCNYWRKIS